MFLNHTINCFQSMRYRCSIFSPLLCFKSSYGPENRKRNYLWNSMYIYQTTRRQMSEGINLRSHRRGKILSCHRLEFHFYLSLSSLLFLSSLPSFLSTVFLLSSPANRWKFINSVQFRFLILHEDLNRRNGMRFNKIEI